MSLQDKTLPWGCIAQLDECLYKSSVTQNPWCSGCLPESQYLEVQGEGSGVQVHPLLPSEFEASLSYMRPWLGLSHPSCYTVASCSFPGSSPGFQLHVVAVLTC